MPTFTVPADAMTDGKINIVDMLPGGIDKSKGKVRTLIEQGSISLDDERVDDTRMNVTKEQPKNSIKIRKASSILNSRIQLKSSIER